MSQEPQPLPLTQRSAELLVRHVWIGYNNISLYGQSHPLTLAAFDDAVTYLNAALTEVPVVTLHMEQTALFCEEWRMDRRICGDRLVKRLADAKLNSISFHRDIERADLHALLCALGDNKGLPTVDSMAESLQQQGIKGLRFNYVSYRKITMDETVVRHDLGDIAQLFTSDNILSQSPPSSHEDLLSSPAHLLSPVGGHQQIMQRLAILRQRVAVSDTNTPAVLNKTEIIESLALLRRDMLEQPGFGAGSGPGEKPLTQLAQLTDDVIVRLVMQEFSDGSVSVPELAQLLRRLCPDPADIKRLLPKLKPSLLTAGFSVQNYLELVRELAGVYAGEDLVSSLTEAGHEFGITLSELAHDVAKNPKAAVQLVLLASEIATMQKMPADRVVSLLSSYIETVAKEQMVPDRDSLSPHDMQRMIGQVESDLISHLSRHGISADIVRQLSTRLSQRLSELLLQFRTETLLSSTIGDLLGADAQSMHDLLGELTQRAALAVSHLGAEGSGDNAADGTGVPTPYESTITTLQSRGCSPVALDTLRRTLPAMAEEAYRSSVYATELDTRLAPAYAVGVPVSAQQLNDAGRSLAATALGIVPTDSSLAHTMTTLRSDISRHLNARSVQGDSGESSGSQIDAALSQVENSAQLRATLTHAASSAGGLDPSELSPQVHAVLDKAQYHIEHGDADTLSTQMVLHADVVASLRKNGVDPDRAAAAARAVEIAAQKALDERFGIDRMNIALRTALGENALYLPSDTGNQLYGVLKQVVAQSALPAAQPDDPALSQTLMILRSSVTEKLATQGVDTSSSERTLAHIDAAVSATIESQKIIGALNADIRSTLGPLFPQDTPLSFAEYAQVEKSVTPRLIAALQSPEPGPLLDDTVALVHTDLLHLLEQRKIDSPAATAAVDAISSRVAGLLMSARSRSSEAKNGVTLATAMQPDLSQTDPATLTQPEATLSPAITTDLGEPDETVHAKPIRLTGERLSKAVALPPELMRASELKIVLTRELRRSTRFSTPLCCIGWSIAARTQSGLFLQPTQEQYAEWLPLVATKLKSMLRDIDLLASLGPAAENLGIIVCVQTGPEGAAVLLERLTTEFSLLVQPDAVLITATTTFDPARHTEAALLLRQVKAALRKAVKQSESG